MHVAVLPGAKPKQDHPKIVRSSAFDDLIHIREIEMALLRLELLPIHRSLDGVGM